MHRSRDSSGKKAKGQELGKLVKRRSDHGHKRAHQGPSQVQLKPFGCRRKDAAKRPDEFVQDGLGDGRALSAEQKRRVEAVADVENARQADIDRCLACDVARTDGATVENWESQRFTEDLRKGADVRRQSQPCDDSFEQANEVMQYRYGVANLRPDLEDAAEDPGEVHQEAIGRVRARDESWAEAGSQVEDVG